MAFGAESDGTLRSVADEDFNGHRRCACSPSVWLVLVPVGTHVVFGADNNGTDAVVEVLVQESSACVLLELSAAYLISEVAVMVNGEVAEVRQKSHQRQRNVRTDADLVINDTSTQWNNGQAVLNVV